MTDILQEIARKLLSSKNKPGSIYLYPHVGIDGDALGSALALLIAFRKAGLKARLLLDEPVPDRLKFLPGLDLLEPFNEPCLPDIAADQIMALAVDCSEGNRVGRRQEIFDRAPETIVIDHHVSGGESGFLRYIDAAAAATGEIAYDLIRLLEKELQQELLDQTSAVLLMTAIMSDTGGFVYSNTSAQTFYTAANLMSFRINLRQITYQLFDMTSRERMRLMGRLFTDAQFHCDGRLVLSVADQQLLDEFGATDSDLDGVISHLRNVSGVEAAFLIREIKDGTLRVNIRSGDHFNASDFARKFGGGGHAKAAGLQFENMTMAAAARLILEKAGECL